MTAARDYAAIARRRRHWRSHLLVDCTQATETMRIARDRGWSDAAISRKTGVSEWTISVIRRKPPGRRTAIAPTVEALASFDTGQPLPPGVRQVRPHAGERYVPTGPLAGWLAAHGWSAVGFSVTLGRSRTWFSKCVQRGRISLWAADEACARLDIDPEVLWGDLWDEAWDATTGDDKLEEVVA